MARAGHIPTPEQALPAALAVPDALGLPSALPVTRMLALRALRRGLRRPRNLLRAMGLSTPVSRPGSQGGLDTRRRRGQAAQPHSLLPLSPLSDGRRWRWRRQHALCRPTACVRSPSVPVPAQQADDRRAVFAASARARLSVGATADACPAAGHSQTNACSKCSHRASARAAPHCAS